MINGRYIKAADQLKPFGMHVSLINSSRLAPLGISETALRQAAGRVVFSMQVGQSR